MVAITKAEKEEIVKNFKNVHIVRTMKQCSKRHHYYCEETRQIVCFLEKLRSCDGVYQKDLVEVGT